MGHRSYGRLSSSTRLYKMLGDRSAVASLLVNDSASNGEEFWERVAAVSLSLALSGLFRDDIHYWSFIYSIETYHSRG
jgi:hypothetical protein